MMSDQPWAVAWYGNRPCVSLTLTASGEGEENSFRAIHDIRKNVSALFLGRLTLDQPFFSGVSSARLGDWGDFTGRLLLDSELPEGFPLHHAPEEYLRGAGHLFLTDRKRWGEQEGGVDQ